MDILEQLKETLEKAIGTIEILQEHADPRGVLRELVRDKTEIIFSHLYKIYGFGENHPTTIHHWCAELIGFFNSFVYKKYKHTNKYMPVEDIVDAMKSKFVDVEEFKTIPGDLLGKYGRSVHGNRELYNLILQTIPEIVNYMRSLGEDDIPEPNDVENIVKELCPWM